MQLQWQQPDAGLFVRRLDARSVTVVDRVLAASFVLTPSEVIAHWPVTDIDALAPEHLTPILALAPEVLLLGSGQKLRFPKPLVAAQCLTRGIGLETMDNAACARTFNVLAGEGRKVVAAFILAPDPT
jgi:uncharacterized protein